MAREQSHIRGISMVRLSPYAKIGARGSPFQQNLEDGKLAVVILNRNRRKLIRRVLAPTAAAVLAVKPESWTVVELPDF
jgi:hypothetical protein